MDISKNQPPKTGSRISKLSLYLGILVWFVDLNTVYALPSVACEWGWFPFTIAGLPGLVWIEGIITVISMALMLYLIYASWRNWRQFQSKKPADNPHLLKDTERSRRSLMSFAAMMVNSFFFLFIIAFFVPMLSLNACIRG